MSDQDGYYFDEQTRSDLLVAVEKYKLDPNARYGMNEFIMKIEQPLVETIHRQKDELRELKTKLQQLQRSKT